MQGPREIELSSAGMRTRTWLGADKGLVSMAAALSVVIALFGLASKLWFLLALAPFLFIGAVLALRMFCKRDPLYFKVYPRAIMYRSFYPAKSGLYSRKARIIPKGWV